MAKKIKEPATRGRPTKYDPSYCEKIIEYFDKPLYKESSFGKQPELNEFPTLEYFAAKELGVTKKTLLNWAAENPEFLHALEQAKALQQRMLLQGGISRAYDSSFAKFIMNSISDTYKDQPVKIDPTEDAKKFLTLGYSLPKKGEDNG